MGIVFLTIRYIVRPDVSAIDRPETRAFVEGELRSLGPMMHAEKWAVGWGGLLVVLWMVPDAANAFASPEFARLVNERAGLVVPALLVPVAMCLFPVGPERQPVLTWDAWARGVEWGMILFIGGVLVLGSAVAEPATGIPDALRLTLEPLLGGLPEYAIVFALALAVLIVTRGGGAMRRRVREVPIVERSEQEPSEARRRGSHVVAAQCAAGCAKYRLSSGASRSRAKLGDEDHTWWRRSAPPGARSTDCRAKRAGAERSSATRITRDGGSGWGCRSAR